MRLKPLLKHPMGRLLLSGVLLLAAVCCVVLLFEQQPAVDDAFMSLRTAVTAGQAEHAPSANFYYYVTSAAVLVEERTKYKLKLLHFLAKLYSKRKHRSKQLASLFGSLQKDVRHFTAASDWQALEAWVDTRALVALGYDWQAYNQAKQEVMDSVGYTSFQLKESRELQLLHHHRGEPRAGSGVDQSEVQSILANVEGLLEARAARERYRIIPDGDKLNNPQPSYPAPACGSEESSCVEAGVIDVEHGEQPVSGGPSRHSPATRQHSWFRHLLLWAVIHGSWCRATTPATPRGAIGLASTCTARMRCPGLRMCTTA